MFEYKYPHPAVTVDCVVFGMNEDLEESAKRELVEETGVNNLYLEQFGTFGKPDRDPRERVITIAYFAIVNLFEHTVKADTDAEQAAWFPLGHLPQLAFDHKIERV